MRVRLASLNGRLALVLRGSDDAGLAKMSGPIGEGALFNVSKGVQPLNRNLVSVKVRDRRTGKEELLTFEDGERVRE
jgi:hypothetical protein